MNLLYIHIPYCAAKCDYCDFYSIPITDRATPGILVEKLLLQLRMEQDFLMVNQFDTVYIGGGTPSILPLGNLEALIEGISGAMADSPAEWTIEANPSSLDREKIQLLEQGPVDRISLGIQSFSTAALNYLGRRGSVEQSVRTLELLSEGWSGSLSVDFMRALPGNVSLTFPEELEALPVPPDHLSVYDLILENGTPLSGRLGRQEIDTICPENVSAVTNNLGYRQYEVSNYARPGHESLHNIGYWEMEPYLGIGPGSVSLQNLGAGWARREEATDLQAYGSSISEPAAGFIAVSPQDFLIEHLIMGFRQIRGLNLDLIVARFGREFSELVPATFEKGMASGSLKMENRRLRLIGEAYWFQNSFLISAWQELEQRKCFA